MAQTYTADVYAAGHVAATDLQNIETNFAALKSSFSGASSPANTEAGMFWFDTSQKCLKIRNDTDSSWWGIMHGDASQKVLVYRNSAMNGWAIDSSITDKAVAIKGGTTYTTGGATAGSWTISGISTANESSHTHTVSAHNHQWYSINGGPAFYYTYSSGGSLYAINNYASEAAYTGIATDTGAGDDPADFMYQNAYTSNASPASGAGTAHSHTATQNGNWRISAAVFTLQYLDL